MPGNSKKSSRILQGSKGSNKTKQLLIVYLITIILENLMDLLVTL